MTALLPEPVLRWIRLQKELGIDEVFLDETWAPPTPQVEGNRSHRSRQAPGSAGPDRRTAPPPPPTPDARRPAAPASQVSSSLNQRSQPLPGSAGLGELVDPERLGEKAAGARLEQGAGRRLSAVTGRDQHARFGIDRL